MTRFTRARWLKPPPGPAEGLGPALPWGPGTGGNRPCPVPTLDTGTQSFPLDNSAYLHLCKKVWFLECALPGASLQALCLLRIQNLPVPPPSPPAPRLWEWPPSAACHMEVSGGAQKSGLQDKVRTSEVPGGTRVGVGGRRDLLGMWGAPRSHGTTGQPCSPGHGCVVGSPGLRCAGWKAIRFPEKQRFSAALTCFAFTGVTRKES